MKTPIGKIAGGINATCFAALYTEFGLFLIAPLSNDGFIEATWIATSEINKAKSIVYFFCS